MARTDLKGEGWMRTQLKTIYCPQPVDKKKVQAVIEVLELRIDKMRRAQLVSLKKKLGIPM